MSIFDKPEQKTKVVDNNRDGKIQYYVDRNGDMRQIGTFINSNNLEAIGEALDELTGITGVLFEEVGSEWDSELSFHKVRDFSLWGIDEKVNGLNTRSRDGLREHVYWEPMFHHSLAEYVIYHEVAHAMGVPELKDPFSMTSNETVMSYLWVNGVGSDTQFTDFDIKTLQEIW